MREYILEKVDNTPKHFLFGRIKVDEIDPMPKNINLSAVLKSIENNFPPHYFNNLQGVKIIHLQEFDEREVNALYRDNILFITNKQKDTKDLMDDIIHEFAHHMEILFPEKIYSDKKLINEFKRKRKQLEFELKSEGYWTKEYDFSDLKYNEDFDIFLYKRVGRNMLRMVTTGIFIRPYASVSLREYFATGFEAYYLGKQDTLQRISPNLFDKINELHYYKAQ